MRLDRRDDRGVTPVIGIILIVAIVVILAAVVGAYAMGLGNENTEPAPNLRFAADHSATGPNSDYLNVTVQGGDRAETDKMHFVVSGATAGGSDVSLSGDPVSQAAPELETGDTISINATHFNPSTGNVDLSDATVTLVWNPDPSLDPGSSHQLWTWDGE